MGLNPEARKLIWQEFRNSKCRECPLHKTAQTVCLMGDGPVPAEVMVVGEAPGFREDEIHKPFAGRSGQYLGEILKSVGGIDRADIFITNAAKCRPPENRTPKKVEFKACRHYLDDEVRTVQPKFILTLGNGGLSLVKKSGITKHRGSVIKYGEALVFPTFHPAAILRNPKYEQIFKADIAQFGRLVRGEQALTRPPRTVLVRSTGSLKQLIDHILAAPAIAYDIETSRSTEWDDHAVIACIGVAVAPDLAFVVPLWHPQSPWKRPDAVLGVVARALMFTNGKRIAQNAKFDDRWIQHYGFPVFADFDTMIAAHMLDENQFKGLGPLASIHLGVEPWKNLDLGEPGTAMTTPLPKLARYNAKDAAYTLRLYSLFRTELTKPGNERTLRLFVKLLMPASKAITTVERNGLWVDQKRLKERLIQVNRKLDQINRKLAKAIGHTINWNSTQQLAGVLFGELGLPVLETTKGGAPSTKESVLLALRPKHKVARLLMDWRQWSKWKSTYLERWAQVVDPSSRMHPNYKITGTVTGRLSSGKDPETSQKKERGLNVQQVPRDPFIRSVIGAPPGWRFVEADFSQIELRIAAFISRDSAMQRLFLLGEDIHLQTAVQMTGKRSQDVTKEERKKAKAVNFGFLYGMGAKKFVIYARDHYDVEVSLEEAEAFRARFFDAYKALHPWHARQRRLANLYHRVQSPIGRVRHLPDILSPDKEVRGEAERQAINSPVQSLASDMMLLSLVLLDEQLPPHEVRIVGSVHDSLLFEIRKDKVEKWVSVIRETMEHLPLEEKFGLKFTVPIKADITIGRHWSEGKAA